MNETAKADVEVFIMAVFLENRILEPRQGNLFYKFRGFKNTSLMNFFDDASNWAVELLTWE
jgi:hypothetical protein